MWACFQAGSVAGGGQGAAEGYAAAVLQGPVCSQLVAALLQGNCTAHDSYAAQSILVEVFKQTMPLKGTAGWWHDLLYEGLGSELLKLNVALVCLHGAQCCLSHNGG